MNGIDVAQSHAENHSRRRGRKAIFALEVGVAGVEAGGIGVAVDTIIVSPAIIGSEADGFCRKRGLRYRRRR